MLAWETIDRTHAPDGAELVLARRGTEWQVRAAGLVLMVSHAHGSDCELGWEAEHRLVSLFYPALHWKRKRESARPTQ